MYILIYGIILGIKYMEILRLAIQNYGFILGGLINICLALFVLIKTRKQLKLISAIFFLFMVSVAIFQFSHVFGIMASDAETSRRILMFNLTDIFIGIFLCHWLLLATNRFKYIYNYYIMVLVYISGITMFSFFIFKPFDFLLPSVQKLYFPFYYNPGEYYYIMALWFMIVGLYYLYEIFRAYIEESDPVKRNRYRYVFISILWGFILGPLAFFLVFNIPIDPFYSVFFGLFTIPLTYCMIQYELFDIKIIARRSVLYGFSVAIISIFLTSLIYTNQYVTSNYPLIPPWTIPLTVSLIGAIIGIVIWRQLRSNDVLKDELVTIITHKFRTPLTYIKWVTNDIQNIVPKEKYDEVKNMIIANDKLIRLVELLANMADEEKNNYKYAFEIVDINETIIDLKNKYEENSVIDKKFTFEKSAPLFVYIDKQKIKFVLEIILDNAFKYISKGSGQISIKLSKKRNTVLITISDNGIGFNKDELALLFNKFYRTREGRSIDTEGIGISLFIAQKIIRRHGGKIWAESMGIGQGSTFFVELL